MRLTFLLHVLIVGMLCCLSCAVSAVTIVTESYPPFNMVNPKTGEITGLATDRVNELMRRANEKYSLTMMPWARGLRLARSQNDTCVFSTARTTGRETSYKWVGPLVGNKLVVFGRAGDQFRPVDLEDLRFKVIGTKRDDASNEFFSSIGYATDASNSDYENPRKLMHGRFDYWATGELLGLEIIKQQGLMKEIVPFFVFKYVNMYLACNSGMKQAKIDRWNEILRNMEQDGTNTAIKRKYQ